MTYINYITPEHGWNSPADLRTAFSDFTWQSGKQRFLPDPAKAAWNADFNLPDDRGLLNVKAEQGTRRVDDMPIVRFELSARGLGGEKSPDKISEWFSIAHEWIVRGFADLTNLQMQKKVWMRDDKLGS